MIRRLLIILGAAMLADVACAQSPSLIGLPQASTPACASGEYWLSVDSGAAVWKKCEDGTVSDLDALAGGGGGGAPTTANYLTGSSQAGLSAEIVVGTTPGGELGGTWASPTLDDGVTVNGWTLGTLGAGFTTGGDIAMADNDITNPDAIGADIYYADTIAEAQAALTRCGSDITGSTQSGCIVQLTGALMDDGGATLHLAGDGTAAQGRAGVILRGVGGSTAAGVDGNPNAGTIIKASGAGHTMIDIGACMGCMIENLTLAGEDIATVGVDFLAPATTPTTRFVMRNVAMYELNGVGIRTATSGQVDTLLFENVSVRDSKGPCYQQRYSQNIGVILSNFDCSMQGTATAPLFDIVAGEFNLRDSFVSVKNNETAFRFGTAAIGRIMIDGNQIEFPTSTSAVIFDFDEGTGTNPAEATISSNHFVYDQNGNYLLKVVRRGAINFENNIVQNVSGSGDKSFSTSIVVDEGGTPSANNQLYLGWSGNIQVNSNSGDSLTPERFLPTISANSQSVYPTVLTPILSNVSLPTPCLDGEIGTDTNATAGQHVYSCESGAWVLQGDGVGGGGGGSLPVTDTTSIAEGSSDPTKEVRFEVDGISAGTVRVLTMPDFNVDLGAIADASVSDTLTASIFKGSGTTTNAVDLATAEVSGLLPVANAGNGSAPASDDQVNVSSSTSAAAWKTLPDSDGATQKLQYDQTTNAFSAGTDDDVPESGDFGNAADLDVTGAVKPNAVALSTDTTGNYVATIADSGTGEVTVSGSGSEGAAVVLALSPSMTRDSDLAAYTTGTATPADGSTACSTGDMYLETDAFKIYFCTDGATDKWYGVALVDTP